MTEYRKLRKYSGRFSGVDVCHPKIGQLVEVVEGDFVGDTFEVTDLRGHLYNLAYRVYVKTPDGIPTWYWPWNLKFAEND